MDITSKILRRGDVTHRCFLEAIFKQHLEDANASIQKNADSCLTVLTVAHIKEVRIMARKQSIENLFHTNLKDKICFGQSKHSDKIGLGFGESTYKIYSYDTYNTYLKECLQYSKWLETEKDLRKTDDISKTEQYVKEYLQTRLDSGISIYTIKMERSALGMLYSKQIDFEIPIRDNKNITRSRRPTEGDKHYSENGKYKDVFILGRATGGRRSDLLKLTTNSFLEKDGHLYVRFEQSKGGRNRLTYVREEYAQEIKDIIQKTRENSKEKIFDRIPGRIDVHSLRREYCKGLYAEIKDNKGLRDDILKNYPPRCEYKTQKDKDGNRHTREIQRDYYKDRDGNIYNRDDIYLCSQCLGHNRLDVSITHYLKS